MLLTSIAHKLFDELEIWLTPLEVDLVPRLRVID